jgi:hypothetical protein
VKRRWIVSDMIPSRQWDPVVLKQHETIWILSFCERWMHPFDGESLVVALLLPLLPPVDFERCGALVVVT